MTNNVRVRLVRMRGNFQIGLPEGWETEVADGVFTASGKTPAGAPTLLHISVMGLQQPAQPGDGTAEEMLDNYIGFLGWDVDPEDKGPVSIDGGDGARFAHIETAEQPMKPVPSEEPTMWQVWFAVKNTRFAHISQRIIGGEDDGYGLGLGRSLVENTFEWLDEE